jgi:hypothetical protein
LLLWRQRAAIAGRWPADPPCLLKGDRGEAGRWPLTLYLASDEPVFPPHSLPAQDDAITITSGVRL